MSDLISRQVAIDAINKYWDGIRDRHKTLDGEMAVYADCKRIIKQLPSAQPEQKKGKWIIRDNPGTGWYRVTCSECGEDVTSTIPMIGFFPNAKPLWDYCPYCGAKMEE